MSFEGPGVFDTFSLLFTIGVPPDTNGDVGPDHYVASTNLTFQIYDKSGVPQLPFAVPTSVVFTDLGGTGDPAGCEFLESGDPIVLYDHLADRWLISQFALNIGTGPYFQCIAISQTPDPTGAYYAYEFPDPNGNIGDYPHYGVWPDGYYMTVNEFDGSTLTFVAGGNHVFERDRMLVGDPAARNVYFSSGLWAGGLPSDLDGPPPPPGTPNVFAFPDADEYGGMDSLVLFDFSVDWSNPSSSTFAERPESPLTVAAFNPIDPSGPASSNDIPQPPPAGATESLDAIQDRLMHRLQFRNFGTHHSLVTNHTVNVDATGGYQAGVRYYELRNGGSGFTVVEEASYAPDADHRWMGSAALDGGGNLAVGFSVSSTTTYPSVRYAGRLAGDTPGGLTQGEQTLIAGSGVQTDASGRWGDYSSLSVDPVDDCSFWYIQEYYTAADSPPGTGPCPGFFGAQITTCWHTRVGKFSFSGPGYSCSAAPSGTLQGTARDAGTLAPIEGVLVTANGFAAATDAAGVYSIPNVAAGSYDVTASKPGHVAATAVGVAVTDGGTTVQDFDLVAGPTLTIQSVTVDDSGGNDNGLINANECVALDVTVINTTGGAATGVTGVLTTVTPGVTITVDESPYPDIAGGGGTGTNTVSFKLSTAPGFPAGADIEMTFDISTDQGPFQDTAQLGTSVGTPGAPERFEMNTPVAIVDFGTASSPVTVSGITDALFDVEVELYITHTWDADLVIELVAPGGTAVTLASQVGSLGDNFGTDCPAGANDTRFSDSATTPIASGEAPFVGTFIPEEPLAAFAALAPSDLNGVWNLRVTDLFPIEQGVIECWALTLTEATPEPGPGECAVEPLEIFADGFESGDVSAWSSSVGLSASPGHRGPATPRDPGVAPRGASGDRSVRADRPPGRRGAEPK